MSSQKSDSKTYIGLAFTDLKKRLRVHREALKDQIRSTNQTFISRYVLDLKTNIKWKLIDRGKPFSPVTGACQFCTKEKFYIMYKQEMAELNPTSHGVSDSVAPMGGGLRGPP